MMIPTVEGTRKAELQLQIEAAGQALAEAMRVMCKAAPNVRDYQDDDDFRQAARKHVERVRAVIKVLDDLDEIYEGIVEQSEKRT